MGGPCLSRSKILAAAFVLSFTAQLHAQSIRSVDLLKTLTGHTKSIVEIAFSPRGEIVAASSKDGTVRLWSSATGEPLGPIVGPKNAEASKLSWSGDARRLAITYRLKKSSELVICEISSTQPPGITHTFPVADFVAWSPDNRTFLAWDQQSKLKLWDAVTGQPTNTLTPEVSPGKQLIAAFVANGQKVLTASLDGAVELWDVVTGKRIETYVPNTEFSDPTLQTVQVPALSADKRFFISGNRQVYEAASGQTLTSIKDGIPISFSPDGQTLLTARYDDSNKSSKMHLTVQLVTGGKEISTFVIPDHFSAIYWSPNGEKIAIVGYEFDTRVFDTATGREIGRPFDNCWPWQLCGSDGCEALRFSADGALLLQEKQPIKLWDTKTASFIKELKNTRLPAVFSPTERLLATRSEDKKGVLLWRF